MATKNDIINVSPSEIYENDNFLSDLILYMFNSDKLNNENIFEDNSSLKKKYIYLNKEENSLFSIINEEDLHFIQSSNTEINDNIKNNSKIYSCFTDMNIDNLVKINSLKNFTIEFLSCTENKNFSSIGLSHYLKKDEELFENNDNLNDKKFLYIDFVKTIDNNNNANIKFSLYTYSGKWIKPFIGYENNLYTIGFESNFDEIININLSTKEESSDIIKDVYSNNKLDHYCFSCKNGMLYIYINRQPLPYPIDISNIIEDESVYLGTSIDLAIGNISNLKIYNNGLYPHSNMFNSIIPTDYEKLPLLELDFTTSRIHNESPLLKLDFTTSRIHNESPLLELDFTTSRIHNESPLLKLDYNTQRDYKETTILGLNFATSEIYSKSPLLNFNFTVKRLSYNPKSSLLELHYDAQRNYEELLILKLNYDAQRDYKNLPILIINYGAQRDYDRSVILKLNYQVINSYTKFFIINFFVPLKENKYSKLEEKEYNLFDIIHINNKYKKINTLYDSEEKHVKDVIKNSKSLYPISPNYYFKKKSIFDNICESVDK